MLGLFWPHKGEKKCVNFDYIQGPRVKFDTFEKKYKKCHNSFKKCLIYEFKKVKKLKDFLGSL